MRSARFLFCALFALLPFSVSQGQSSDKPNIVVILVDDAALMDFGIYGGEAKTPHVDALARGGAIFTQYRTSPLCSPSRAMLLTGMDNHLTGIATIPEVLPAEHVDQPGYTMRLEPGVLTLADRLRPEGYRTLMTGKWHMGSEEGDLPADHGFDRSFALDASGADNWEDKSYMPFYKDAPWYEGREAVALPDEFYSSEFIVDKMVEYIKMTKQDQPFLAYMAFQAIHIPVQAPKAFIDNYDGIYNDGWHALRQRRYEKAISLGLIPNGVPLAPIPDTDRKWNELTPDEQSLYARMMQANSGMLEAMDFHIGEFVDYLKNSGQFDNTIFVVTSDNGPEPNRGDNDRRLAFWMHLNGYDVELENVGQKGSWGFIGPEWANAAASPGALYKFYMTEGGIRAPLIISGPGIEAQKVESMALVTDIAPTVMDLALAPQSSDKKVPMTGRSLLPVLSGQSETTYSESDPIGMEVSGNAALYKGNFKITRSVAPVGDGQWRLYDLATDPGETQDLSTSTPDKYSELLSDYQAYAKRVGVLEMPEGYDSAKQVEKNSTAKFLEHNVLKIIVLFLVLISAILLLIRFIRKTLNSRPT